MPRLIPCPQCVAHIKLSEVRCPHCQHRVLPDKRLGLTASALVLGLSIGACTSSHTEGKQDTKGAHEPEPKPAPEPVAEPEYGMPMVPDVPPATPAPAYGAPDPADLDPPKKEPRKKIKK